MFNSQRGVPYYPTGGAAARSRTASQKAGVQAQTRNVEQEIRAVGSAPISPKKEEAIRRDQIEAMWRQRARDRRY